MVERNRYKVKTQLEISGSNMKVEFKLSDEIMHRDVKQCREWIKEMKKNPIAVDNLIRQYLYSISDCIGSILRCEMTLYTPFEAVIYTVLQSVDEFFEIYLTVDRCNTDYWDGWCKQHEPIVHKYTKEF